MALRDILIYPTPPEQKAKPVAEVDASIRKLCDDMAETMYEANGVGLAAPQLGVLHNVIASTSSSAPPWRASRPRRRAKASSG